MSITYGQLIFHKLYERHLLNLATHYTLCLIVAVDVSSVIAVRYLLEPGREDYLLIGDGHGALYFEACVVAQTFLQIVHKPFLNSYKRSLVCSLVEGGYPDIAVLLLKEIGLHPPDQELEGWLSLQNSLHMRKLICLNFYWRMACPSIL